MIVSILIAPNDWWKIFKIAVGVGLAGGALLWMWRGGSDDDGGGDPVASRPPMMDQQPGDGNAQPIVPSIRGLPNQKNDCFLNSVIQLLASAYPALLTVNETMRPAAPANAARRTYRSLRDRHC